MHIYSSRRPSWGIYAIKSGMWTEKKKDEFSIPYFFQQKFHTRPPLAAAAYVICLA